MYYRPHSSKNLCLFGRPIKLKPQIVVLLFIFILILFFVNLQLSSLLEAAASIEAKRAYNSAVNAALSELMSERGELCADIVSFSESSNGTLSALSTNTAALNTLKAELSLKLSERLSVLENEPLYVPLGSLSGIELFSGMGPDVKIRIKLIGSAATNIGSSLIDAGVNQTLHTVSCAASAEFWAIIPGARSRVALSCETILAQSVIIGAVPDSYTVVNGDESDTIGRIFDYGDPYGKDVGGD